MEKINLNDLANELKDASSKYYNTGTSPMTDQEFDKKLELLQSLGGDIGVGAPVLDELRKVQITGRPMLSLPKAHSPEEVKDFLKGRPAIAMTKLDGLSVRLIYENGELVSANTRGNGEVGTDITEHVKVFTNVPRYIHHLDRLVVDGEAIIKGQDFAEINVNGAFKNPRNTAAGALNLLDLAEVAKRRLSFIAWDWIEGAPTNLLQENLTELSLIGFEIVPYLAMKNPDIDSMNSLLLGYAEKKGLPCDGVVWKFNSVSYGLTQPSTAHHLGNGIAWKPADDSAWTELLDIEWSMGRTGQITPIAIFKPVGLEETMVSRASLHNVSVMRDVLGAHPYPGQPIEIIKSNQIIPYVRSAVKKANPSEEFFVPSTCPLCGEPLDIQEGILVCKDPACEGKFVNQVVHFCSKKGLDIRGLSKATIEKLVDWGWVNDFTDIFKLQAHRGEWASRPGFGAKSVDNILTAVEAARSQPLDKFIVALGIPLIGASAAKELKKHFHSWANLYNSISADFKFYELPNFGEAMHIELKHYDYTIANELIENYITIQEEAESAESISANVAITGTLQLYKNRAELTEAIEKAGGKVVSSVSKNTDILINNDPYSSSAKNVVAQRLGIPIMTEEEFYNLYLS